MDDLIKELIDRAGLSEEQAKAAAEVVVEWVKDEDKRKKILVELSLRRPRRQWSPAQSDDLSHARSGHGPRTE